MTDERPCFRIQAHWTVGDEAHSYRPVYVRGRAAADEARTEMAETLAHFPTLHVEVTEVSVAEAEQGPAESRQVVAAWIDPSFMARADRDDE